MEQEYLYNNENYSVNVEKKDDLFRITINDKTYSVHAKPLSDHLLSLMIDDRSVLVHTAENDGERIICIHGVNYTLQDPSALEDQAGGAGGGGGGGGVVSTPMPGKIVDVHVKEGDVVEPGQVLVVVESMKMQNDMVSEVKGTVKKVHFTLGDQASFGDALIEIEVDE